MPDCSQCRYLPQTDSNLCIVQQEPCCPDDPACDRFIERKTPNPKYYPNEAKRRKSILK